MGLMGSIRALGLTGDLGGWGKKIAKRVHGEKKNQENQHKWLEMFCYLAEFQ